MIYNSNALFTSRELCIMTLVAQGKSDRQIADVFKVAERTVQTNTANIYRKMGLRTDYLGNNRCTMVAFALINGYVSIDHLRTPEVQPDSLERLSA